MTRDLLDAGTLSALIDATAGLGCVWMMQAVTPDAGFATTAKLVKLLHRVSYGLLSTLLFISAAMTFDGGASPRVIDIVVHFGFLFVVAMSVVRHLMARPVVIVQEPLGVVTKIIEKPPPALRSVHEGDRIPISALRDGASRH